MYVCINVLTKVMYFQPILNLLGVNKYYGYGYGNASDIAFANFLYLSNCYTELYNMPKPHDKNHTK